MDRMVNICQKDRPESSCTVDDVNTDEKVDKIRQDAKSFEDSLVLFLSFSSVIKLN
jgi:hypothetical protein